MPDFSGDSKSSKSQDTKPENQPKINQGPSLKIGGTKPNATTPENPSSQSSSHIPEKPSQQEIDVPSESARISKEDLTGENDPLLSCLYMLTKLHNRTMSKDALAAGLPLQNNRLSPQIFVRAAARAGIYAKITKRSIDKISNMILPAVLLCAEDSACVLHKINSDNTVDVSFSETEGGVTTIPFFELKKNYSGIAIFAQPVYNFDSRAKEFNRTKPRSWFWGTLLKYKNIYARVFIAALLVNIFALATPLFIMLVYDRVVPNEAVETLWVLASGVAIIFGFDFLMRIIRAYLIDTAGKKADVILASNIFQHALNIKMSSRPASAGAFANNLKDFEVLREFFTSATLTTIVDIPFIFLFLWIIAIIGGYAVLIPLFAIPIVIISAIIISIPMKRAVEESVFGATQKHAVLVESITGLETIKGMSAEGTMQRRWESGVGITAKASQTSRFYSNLALSITTITTQLVTILVVIAGVYMIKEGMLSVGGLIACTILSGRAIAPLAQVTNVLTRFQQSRMALQGLNTVMSLPVDRPDNKQFLHREKFEGDIKFEEVDFHYPDQQTYALHQVSFHVKPGEHVGIVGSIGSGKSTMQKLIMNFYTPEEGRVSLDGIDVAQLDPADLRRSIGYVPQETALFYGTVRDNIAMKKPWIDDEQILAAAKLSGVDQFVSRDPSGYDMHVGERGENLSGGQRQAISIARALVGNPPIFLMDEPTSSMDSRADRYMLNSLKPFLQDKTLVLVTHKVMMLDLVERLIVIEHGRVVADGPKDTILAALANKPTSKEDTSSGGDNS